MKRETAKRVLFTLLLGLCNVIAVQIAVQISHTPHPHHERERNLNAHNGLRHDTDCG